MRREVLGALPGQPKSPFHFPAELHLDHWQKIVQVLEYCIQKAIEERDEQELFRLQKTLNQVLEELQHAGVEFTKELDEESES